MVVGIRAGGRSGCGGIGSAGVVTVGVVTGGTVTGGTVAIGRVTVGSVIGDGGSGGRAAAEADQPPVSATIIKAA